MIFAIIKCGWWTTNVTWWSWDKIKMGVNINGNRITQPWGLLFRKKISVRISKTMTSYVGYIDIQCYTLFIFMECYKIFSKVLSNKESYILFCNVLQQVNFRDFSFHLGLRIGYFLSLCQIWIHKFCRVYLLIWNFQKHCRVLTNVQLGPVVPLLVEF